MTPRPTICKRESRIARHCVPVGALPPPCGRRCPCTSIRARGARRRVAVDQPIWLAEGGLLSDRFCHLGKPHRGASGRRQSSRGAGGRMRDAGQRAGAVHTLVVWAAQPSMGGRGNDHSSSTRPVCERRTSSPKPNCGGHDSREFFSAEHWPILISNAPKSCRSLVRRISRTRGGLAVLGRNTDMRRHGVLRPKTDEPQPLRGRGA